MRAAAPTGAAADRDKTMTRISLALAAGAALSVLAWQAPAAAMGPTFDPKCFADVPWEVDPASSTIKVWGCRPAADVPAANAAGWVEYDRPQVNGTDGGFIMGRLVNVGADGTFIFDVQDNGGGSGTFGYHVIGKPNADGVLIPSTVHIVALPGD